MTALPGPIRRVMIPQTFSVSQIAAADCFLKVLIEMKGATIEQLPPNPSAELGTVFHSLLEKAVKGFSAREETSVEALEILLYLLLDETHARLERDIRTSSYADLTRTLTPLAWERKRRSFVDVAFEFINNEPHLERAFKGAGNGGFCFEAARRDGCWVEVPIQVPHLRLKGRIDVLERKGEEIKIVDLKSGRVEDADGAVKPQIALQLRLYGILAQTLDPRSHVTLVVNNGTEHSVPFDHGVVAEVNEWLSSTMGSLVPGRIVPADEYAKIGPDCRCCGIRHRCERYLREAPTLWTREIDWRLPLDTWGTVESVTPRNDGMFDLALLDAGGRRVKVFSVRECQLTEHIVGKLVWLFELATSRPALRGNAWRHPLNFHEIGDSDLTDRAWSLQVFIG